MELVLYCSRKLVFLRELGDGFAKDFHFAQVGLAHLGGGQISQVADVGRVNAHQAGADGVGGKIVGADDADAVIHGRAINRPIAFHALKPVNDG